MRSEVYFLPPRTSVTDSVGISTLPILSCRPNAMTRDSSDSFTLRSNPEYEWMMYHFMFGLRGASVVTAAPSVVDGCASAAPVSDSFFSSSTIWCFLNSRVQTRLVSLEVIEQLLHAVLNKVVNDGEVQCKDENG